MTEEETKEEETKEEETKETQEETQEQPQEETQEETQEESKEEVQGEEPKEETEEQPQEAQESTEPSVESMESQGRPRYDTLKTEEFKYGTNNFIEVARKKIDDAEFISLSKGYYTRNGTKRWKNGLGFPDQDDIKNFLIENLKSI